MRILITGFEPYWDYHENSSWEVAKILSSYKSEAFEIVTEQMPVRVFRMSLMLFIKP